MGSIIATVKLISFLYPFLKELFIGKDDVTSKGTAVKRAETSTFVKSIAIVLGCASVAINVQLINYTYSLAAEISKLKKNDAQEKYDSDKGSLPKVPIEEEPAAAIVRRPQQENVRTNNRRNPSKDHRVPEPLAVAPEEEEDYLKQLEGINKIH